jgi:hypothetical protein
MSIADTKRERCEHCTGLMPRTYRRSLNAMHVKTLYWFYESPTFSRMTSSKSGHRIQPLYSAYDKLSFWGLIHQDKDVFAKWWLTRLGQDFVEDKCTVPRTLLIRAGIVLGEAPGTKQVSADWLMRNTKCQYEGPRDRRLEEAV